MVFSHFLTDKNAFVRYGVALAVIGAAYALRLVLAPADAGFPFLTFFPAVTVTALVCGFGPGLLAVVVGGIIGNYSFAFPHGVFGFSDMGPLVFYLGSDVLLCYVIDRLHNMRFRYFQNQQRFKVALANSPVVVFEQDLNLRHTWVNNPKLGYSAEEVLGKTDADIMTPECAAQTIALKRSVIETGQPVSGLVAVAAPGGSLHYFDHHIEPRRDKNGRIDGIVCAAVDITERKLAEIKAAEASERLGFALEGAQAASFELDLRSGIACCSREAYPLFGFPPDTPATIEHWSNSLHPDDKELWWSALERAKAEGCADFWQDYRIIHPTKGIRWLNTRACITYAATGEPKRINGITIDITNLKNAQAQLAVAKAEAERANGAKSRFLAAASHDLRQPIQGLRLLLHLLIQQAATPAVSRLCDTMSAALESTETLLSRLMDFAALECGKVMVNREHFRLDQLVDRLVAEAQQSAHEKGLRLRARAFACTVDSDPVMLEGVLRNLVSNAVRYTDAGGILVGIRKRRDHVLLEVRDTGKGIPEESQTLIFEEFQQLDNPERGREKGMGLGLAIVARTLDLLGHRLTLRSRLEKGSLFGIALPVVADVVEPVADRAPPAPADAYRRARVLLIEDDPIQSFALEAVLAAAGFDVGTAAHAADVDQHLCPPGPDLILSDYRLPGGVSGLDLIHGARKQLARRVPAILVTGDTQASIAEEAALETCMVIHKPYCPDDLVAIVNRTLAPLFPMTKG